MLSCCMHAQVVPSNFFTQSWGSNSRVDFDLADLKEMSPDLKENPLRFSAYLSGVAPVSS